MDTDSTHAEMSMGYSAVAGRLALLLAGALAWLYVGRPVLAQEVEKLDPLNRYHPDGVVGQIAVLARAAYASVSSDSAFTPNDQQTYSLSLSWVARPQVVIGSTYELCYQDSTRHAVFGSARYYLKNPRDFRTSLNPDGPVGGLVIGAGAGVRFSDSPDRATRLVADAGAALPLTERLTLKAGYRYYESIEPSDVDQGYGGITVYLSDYAPDPAYFNPDGPIGSAVIHAEAGGSSGGAFAGLTIGFPLQPELTLSTTFRAAKISERSLLALAAGVVVSVYPRR